MDVKLPIDVSNCGQPCGVFYLNEINRKPNITTTFKILMTIGKSQTHITP